MTERIDVFHSYFVVLSGAHIQQGASFFVFLRTGMPIPPFPIRCRRWSGVCPRDPRSASACYFNNKHSNRCEVVSHCGFDLHFPEISDVGHLSYTCWPCVVFGKISIYICCPVFNESSFCS